MGIGSSLKKFVKKVIPKEVSKAAPIVGVFNPALGAALGVAGGLREGNLGKAALGGLGAYGIGRFAQGMGAPLIGQNMSAGLGSLLKGIPGISQLAASPFGQGVGSIFDKVEGYGGGFKSFLGGGGGGGAQQAGSFSSSYSPTQTNYLDAASDAATGKFSGMPSSKYSDIAMDAATGKFSGFPGADTDEGNLFGNIVDQYNVATEGEGTKSGFMDFVTNMFNERNLPLTAGILGGLAQMFENKQNEGAGDVTLGEGLDYYTDGRGVLTGLANGGRIGFADGDEVRDAEYEGWKQMYEKNPEVAMMMHGNSAEYLEKYNKEMELNSKAKGGIIGLANGGEPTMEMDYRGGGFIPVGAKERADDVPARLSKNEFVMTADAVRAAGGGSIEKGSQRMYDLMNSLEARA